MALTYRVCLKNSLIRNFGWRSAISASSILDLALLSLRISSLNWRKIHSNLRISLFETHSRGKCECQSQFEHAFVNR
jgi:hypothetical protein